MADAAARREARRKRILENSQNRLQLISGKCNDNILRESTNASPIPQNYENIIEAITTESSLPKNSIANGEIEIETELFNPQISRHDTASGDREIANDLTTSQPLVQQPLPTPLWKTVISNKYDIVLLSLLLQILYTLSTIQIENTYFFIPLITYVISKEIWLPKQNHSSIANVLMLLNGMSPNIQRFLHIVFWIGAISQDAAIFLFTTTCTQSIFIMIRDNFVT